MDVLKPFTIPIMEESDEYSEEIDRAFSSSSELNGTPTETDEQTENSNSSEIPDSSPDYEPKGQTFDVAQFSICDVFDHSSTSRRAEPLDLDRFAERDLEEEEVGCFDNGQFRLGELRLKDEDDEEDGGTFDRYSIGGILDGVPGSKRLIADQARIRRMEVELSNLLKQGMEKDDHIRSLTGRLKDSGYKAGELRRQLHALKKRNEELEKDLEEAKDKAEKAQAEVAEAQAQVLESKSKKKSEQDRQTKQLASQHRKQKAELENSVRVAEEELGEAKAELADAKAENRLLGRQKGELFTVVTKQMKLVANLRRQILHLRAGVLKDFTEQEIRKAVESRVKN